MTHFAIIHETFTFTPEKGDPVHVFSGALAQFLNAKARDLLSEIVFPVQPLEQIIEQHGLEAERLASMTQAEALVPIVVLCWPDGSHVLADGGHRRYFWAKRNVNTLQGWMVPYALWSMFTYDPENLPENMYSMDTGELLPQRRKGRDDEQA